MNAAVVTFDEAKRQFRVQNNSADALTKTYDGDGVVIREEKEGGKGTAKILILAYLAHDRLHAFANPEPARAGRLDATKILVSSGQ